MLIKIRPTGQYSCVLTVDGKETVLKSLGMSKIAPIWIGETETGETVVYDFSPYAGKN